MRLMTPPDVDAVAGPEIEKLRRDPGLPERRFRRVLNDWSALDGGALMAGLAAFHRERMQAAPPRDVYPEASAWVEHVLAVDRRVQEETGISDGDLAVLRSLNDYLAFRVMAGPGPASSPERCRVAWVPDTDRGPLHIKNVDDPMPPTWPPRRPVYDGMPHAGPLVWDGVGNGLHLDDEPSQLFPLPIKRMCMRGLETVSEALEFLGRYKPFWGRQNVLLRDSLGEAVAIEKSSFNHMTCHQPNEHGRVWISGMITRDPDSPQGRYVRRQRQAYLDHFNLPPDGPDAAFWRASEAMERKLADAMAQPGPLSCDAVFDLFLKTWPEGLNKDGRKAHPEQAATQYTLVTHGTLFDEAVTYRYERDAKTKMMPREPEVFAWSDADRGSPIAS